MALGAPLLDDEQGLKATYQEIYFSLCSNGLVTALLCRHNLNNRNIKMHSQNQVSLKYSASHYTICSQRYYCNVVDSSHCPARTSLK